MRALLDTHVFLWWATDPDRLPGTVVDLCRSVQTELYLSAASSWEVQIKQRIGKLRLSDPWREIVEREVTQNGVNLLPITFAHTYRLGKIPPLHRDPFDRLLLAQSIVEEASLVTGDTKLHRYPDAPIIWEQDLPL